MYKCRFPSCSLFKNSTLTWIVPLRNSKYCLFLSFFIFYFFLRWQTLYRGNKVWESCLWKRGVEENVCKISNLFASGYNPSGAQGQEGVFIVLYSAFLSLMSKLDYSTDGFADQIQVQAPFCTAVVFSASQLCAVIRYQEITFLWPKASRCTLWTCFCPPPEDKTTVLFLSVCLPVC